MNLTIRARITLLGVMATMSLLCIIGAISWVEYRTLSAKQSLLGLIESEERLSNVIHELQRERGVSAGALIRPTEENLQALATQRAASDRAINSLMKASVLSSRTQRPSISSRAWLLARPKPILAGFAIRSQSGKRRRIRATESSCEELSTMTMRIASRDAARRRSPIALANSFPVLKLTRMTVRSMFQPGNALFRKTCGALAIYP